MAAVTGQADFFAVVCFECDHGIFLSLFWFVVVGEVIAKRPLAKKMAEGLGRERCSPAALATIEHLSRPFESGI